MSEAIVRCLGVTGSHGGVSAVKDLNFELMPGEILSILGPSGCGKTSLLRLIAGFDSVDGGEIYLNGRLASSKGTHMTPDRRNVGMVFQEYALFPHMTVAQNVTFGLKGGLKGSSRSRRDSRLAEVMDLVKLAGLGARCLHTIAPPAGLFALRDDLENGHLWRSYRYTITPLA